MKKKLKNLEQRLERNLTSKTAKFWYRALASVFLLLMIFAALVGTVFYGVTAAYIMKDGLEVLDTIPSELADTAALAHEARELGEVFSVSVLVAGSMFWAFMLRVGFGALQDLLDYQAKIEREKKENEKEA